jgi:hypothetical protein
VTDPRWYFVAYLRALAVSLFWAGLVFLVVGVAAIWDHRRNRDDDGEPELPERYRRKRRHWTGVRHEKQREEARDG